MARIVSMDYKQQARYDRWRQQADKAWDKGDKVPWKRGYKGSSWDRQQRARLRINPLFMALIVQKLKDRTVGNNNTSTYNEWCDCGDTVRIWATEVVRVSDNIELVYLVAVHGDDAWYIDIYQDDYIRARDRGISWRDIAVNRVAKWRNCTHPYVCPAETLEELIDEVHRGFADPHVVGQGSNPI